jgi:hypothetical protein
MHVSGGGGVHRAQGLHLVRKCRSRQCMLHTAPGSTAASVNLQVHSSIAFLATLPCCAALLLRSAQTQGKREEYANTPHQYLMRNAPNAFWHTVATVMWH